MSESSDPKPSAPGTKQAPSAPAAAGRGLAWLALVVALVVGAAVAWLVWQARAMPLAAPVQQLQERVLALETQQAVAAGVVPKLQSLEAQFESLSQRLQVALEQGQRLEKQLSELQAVQRAPAPAPTTMQSVRETVAIAWQVAQATGSAQALQRALEQGAQRLAQSPQAQQQQVGAVLAAQASAYQADQWQDRGALAQQLGQLQQALGALPLTLAAPRLAPPAAQNIAVAATEAEPVGSPSDQRWWQTAGAAMTSWGAAWWRDLSALVQVQRQAGPGWVADEASLRQQLNVQLALARVSILAGDAPQAQRALQELMQQVQPLATQDSTERWLRQVQQQAQRLAAGLAVPEPTQALQALGLK